ncbi:EamA/RhaT family transporter [Bacillus salacetis]|uniref:EamA/RhaT family transporter n=1 Tax=Bacillus salacetis TaxID=2315464 RepID=A0A3A1R628_9BACI|nr:EamA family transporter [Bacillus salacetis]RIW38510.1 EamA/RhaT family transporter [Bacillus salacetis]
MKWKYLFAVFIGACSYGVLSTVVKLAYQNGMKIAEVTFAQFFIGWSILALVYSFTTVKQTLSTKVKLFLIAGGIPSGLVGVFYYTSLQTVEASFAIILLFQFVWIGILLDCAVENRSPDRKTLAAILILLAGTVLSSRISLDGTSSSLDVNGILAGLAAAGAFALFIFANARIAPDISAVQRSFYMVTGSFLFVSLYFLPALLKEGMGSAGNIGVYGTVLGFFGVFIPPFLFAYGMPHIGSSIGSILGSAELPVTIILSMLFLHEYVTWIQWTGIFLILGAIILTNVDVGLKRKRQVLK